MEIRIGARNVAWKSRRGVRNVVLKSRLGVRNVAWKSRGGGGGIKCCLEMQGKE